MVYGTEKIDGTHARIILVHDHWIIGSRDQLLAASGDRVNNPAMGIVDALRGIASQAWLDWEDPLRSTHVLTLHGEVYGHRSTPSSAWKKYTTNGQAGFRLFDVSAVPYTKLQEPVEQIASWRDGGDQEFLSQMSLGLVADAVEVELVPRLFYLSPSEIPTDIEGMTEFLYHWAPTTRAALGDAPPGTAEGIVLRGDYFGSHGHPSGRLVYKARTEDYQRTLRYGKGFA